MGKLTKPIVHLCADLTLILMIVPDFGILIQFLCFKLDTIWKLKPKEKFYNLSKILKHGRDRRQQKGLNSIEKVNLFTTCCMYLSQNKLNCSDIVE